MPVVTCTGEIETSIETVTRPCENRITQLGGALSVTCPECGSVTGVGGPRAARDVELTIEDLRERRADRREMLGSAFADGGVPQ